MIKIYAEVLPTWLGRAIHNVTRYLKEFAPPNVQFVDNVDDADFQVLHMIGSGSMDFVKVKEDRLITFVYCFEAADRPIKPDGSDFVPLGDYWYSQYGKSAVILSYLDLPKHISNPINFYRTPLGVDSKKFISHKSIQKKNLVMSTGHVADPERIREFYTAFSILGYDVVNVGGNFNFGPNYLTLNNLSDEDMVSLYNNSVYCNAMREVAGFEIPAIEGMLTNCRPIMLDIECYRYWFDDFAIFVKDYGITTEMVSEIIEKVLDYGDPTVSDKSRKQVVEKFDIIPVYTAMWDAIIKGVS